MIGHTDRGIPHTTEASNHLWLRACSLVVQYFEVVSGAMVIRIQFQSLFQVLFRLRVSLHLNVQCPYSQGVHTAF